MNGLGFPWPAVFVLFITRVCMKATYKRSSSRSILLLCWSNRSCKFGDLHYYLPKSFMLTGSLRGSDARKSCNSLVKCLSPSIFTLWEPRYGSQTGSQTRTGLKYCPVLAYDKFSKCFPIKVTRILLNGNMKEEMGFSYKNSQFFEVFIVPVVTIFIVCTVSVSKEAMEKP